jgi:hypothetical protein
VNGRLAIVGLLLTAAVSAIFVGVELLRRSNEVTVVPPPPPSWRSSSRVTSI